MNYINTSYYESRQDVTLNDTDFPTTSLVEEWITEASSKIDRDLNKTFEQGTYTYTIISSDLKKRTSMLFLPITPISDVTVQIDANSDDFNQSFTEIENKIMDSELGIIKLRQPVQLQEVQVTYTGGYSDVDIPSNVKRLCYLLVLKNKINEEIRQEAGDDTTTSISSITVSERNPNSLQYKLTQLDLEIDKLYEDLGKEVYVGIY